MDEQVSLTHLHGSTRKNKKGRGWRLQRKKKRERRGGSDVFLWMRCVMQLAGRPLAVPPSSRRASPADSALWKKEKGREQFHKHFWLLRDGGCWTLLKALQTHLSYQGFAPCPQRGTGDRCSLDNLTQNRLHRYQMMPV